MDYYVLKQYVGNQPDQYLMEWIEEISEHFHDQYLEYLDYHNQNQEVMQVLITNVD